MTRSARAFQCGVLVLLLAFVACGHDAKLLQPRVSITASLGSGQFAIEIDATALSAPQLTLNGVASFATTSVQAFNLDPGSYLLFYRTGAVDLSTPSHPPAEAVVNFTVTAGGMIDFAPGLDAIVDGRGTSRLVVHGITIRYDATALSAPLLFVLEGVVLASSRPYSLTLLPGCHILLYRTGAVDFTTPLPHSPADARVQYTVTGAGTLDFEPALDRIMEGRGTASLLVHGLTIQYDATALSAPLLFVLEGVVLPRNRSYSLTLLPGFHILLYPTGAVDPIGHSPADARAQYTVTSAGTVDFDPSLDGILEGHGTSNLKVNGVGIQVDATCMQFVTPSFSLGVLGTFSTGEVHAYALLPGIHPFRSEPLDFDFTVTVSKMLSVDPALAPDVAVLNGTTLVVRVGTEAEIDLVIALVQGLENDGTLSAGRANSLRSKLEAAKQSVARSNADAARGELQAFEHELDALERAGILSPEQAESLRRAAECALELVAT